MSQTKRQMHRSWDIFDIIIFNWLGFEGLTPASGRSGDSSEGLFSHSSSLLLRRVNKKKLRTPFPAPPKGASFGGSKKRP